MQLFKAEKGCLTLGLEESSFAFSTTASGFLLSRASYLHVYPACNPKIRRGFRRRLPLRQAKGSQLTHVSLRCFPTRLFCGNIELAANMLHQDFSDDSHQISRRVFSPICVTNARARLFITCSYRKRIYVYVADKLLVG